MANYNWKRKLRDNRTILVAVLVIGVGLAGWWAWSNQGNPPLNKDYVPIVAALVTGVVTLGSVFIASRVLQFQIKSQANPLMLEHYKERSKHVAELYKLANIFGNLAWLHFNQKDVEKVSEARRATYTLLDEHGLWLSDRLNKVTLAMLQEMWSFFESTGNVQESDTVTREKHRTAREAYNQVLQACREEIKSDELHQVTIDILQGRQKERKES